MKTKERLRNCLQKIYGPSRAEQIYPIVCQKMDTFQKECRHLDTVSPMETRLTERDVFLITYPDQFLEADRPPLQTLNQFLEEHLADCISGVHILPFFPYSSDDGFSVVDYSQVTPLLGSWNDICRIGRKYTLVADVVLNHISAKSEWFTGFLEGKEPYTDFFITIDPQTDLSAVTRPRSTPLLTPFTTKSGVKHVWTTFGEDQVDLNYANPAVLLEMLDVILLYVANGARVLRLDAVAYLWKEPGTNCIHHPKAHQIIKLIRAVLDEVAPNVLLLTETNVPHVENMSYFGKPTASGAAVTDEAQMVYQFPLAPLILYTLHTGNATVLNNWASQLPQSLPGTAFLNFVASHDGIGVRPAESLLDSYEIGYLAERVLAHQGLVSYRTDAQGKESIYELNITLFDALNNPNLVDLENAIERFMASQAIMLSLAGIPAIYVHSLFGSSNCHLCVNATGRARSINREKFQFEFVLKELQDTESKSARIFSRYRHLLQVRGNQPAFHPSAAQRVILDSPTQFILLRTARDKQQHILCLVNITGRNQPFRITPKNYDLPVNETWVDLLSGEQVQERNSEIYCELKPYQCRWLQYSAEMEV